MNEVRKSLYSILRINSPVFDYYVYYYDENNKLKSERFDTVEMMRSVVIGGDKQYYVDIGNWDPDYFDENNILDKDVKKISEKVKTDNPRMYTAGFIVSRIMLYKLIYNCYMMNNVSFIDYYSSFPLDDKIKNMFFSKLEFMLYLNKNLELVIKNMINKDTMFNIILFRTGFPRFSYQDLNKIFKYVQIDKNDILKIVNKLEGDEFINYLEICAINMKEEVEDKKTFTINYLKADRIKNIIFSILIKQYTIDQMYKVKDILKILSDKGLNTNIEIDKYFDKDIDELFYSNRKYFFDF